MPNREFNIERTTKETRIAVHVNLDGCGRTDIHTGVGFFDHMLNSMSKHGLLDLKVIADGDLNVDQHHTVEDVGITMGLAIDKALGEKTGLVRYGWAIVPMDEALVLTSIDLSGRGMLFYDADIAQEKIGDFDSILIPEFFGGLARNCGMTLHIMKISGSDPHHVAEAVFKSFAKAFEAAIRISDRVEGIPSTKGIL